jgi:hypothetical protein
LPSLDWEIKFLKGISSDLTSEEFTTRQGEKLMQIREDSEEISEIGYDRLSVKILIEDCKIGYLDLFAQDEDKAEWIRTFPAGTSRIKRKYSGRLLACARILNNIDDEDAA